jgi:hypothetical protein
MIKIKYYIDDRTGIDGFHLYYDCVKVHSIGTFDSIAALRKFWNDHRQLIVAGYTTDFNYWTKSQPF